jgi:hypothetical protein
MPRRQGKVAIAACLYVRHRLQAGRGRNEHGRCPGEAGAYHGHVAGVVDDAFLLLERRLMLLIHHDEAEIGKRQEQRRARPHHHLRRPRRHRTPGHPPRARGEVRVPHGRGDTEPPLEAFQPLRGERDLRQQHQHLPTLPQTRRDRLKIDLGLARSGHAVEQGHGEAARGDGGAERGGRFFLRGGQRRAGVVGIGRGEGRAGRQGHGQDQPGIRHAPDHAGGHPRCAREFRPAARPLGERRQHAPPRLAQPRLGRRGVGEAPADRRRLRPQRVDPQRHRQHLAGGGERIGGDPVDQAAQIGAHPRRLQDRGERAQARGRQFGIGRAVPHHPDLLPLPEGDEHEIARLRVEAGRHRVIERAGERVGEQHAHAPPPRYLTRR